MKNLILSMILAAGVTFAADSQKLQAMAKSASTPEAHSEVALGYRDWAATLDAKAAKHEDNAERLANSPVYNPMRYKWPAMAAAPAERERRLAMQARRAANEARTLAQKHEALAPPAQTAVE